MKKIITLLTLIAIYSSAQAQKLAIGVKAPELKISEWISTGQVKSGMPVLIEFFYSPSEPSVRNLSKINSWAETYKGKLGVIVMAREPRSKIEPLVSSMTNIAVALDDDNKSFTAYGVQFVPYAVLIDSKGKVIWFGNSTQLTKAIIDSAI